MTERNETPTEQMTMSAPIQRAYESTCPSCGGYVDPRHHDPDCGNVLVAAIATLCATIATLTLQLQEARLDEVELLDSRERALAESARLREENAMSTWPWKPGRWFRVVTPAGELWAETSDEEEARAIADKTGWRLERQWFCQPAEWRVVREATADCRREPCDDFEEPTPCTKCGTVVELQEMATCYDCRMKSGVCEDCMDEHRAEEHDGIEAEGEEWSND